MVQNKSPLISYYPTEYELDGIQKNYYWQCVPRLPLVSDTKMTQVISKISLNKEEQARNKLSKPLIHPELKSA